MDQGGLKGQVKGSVLVSWPTILILLCSGFSCGEGGPPRALVGVTSNRDGKVAARPSSARHERELKEARTSLVMSIADPRIEPLLRAASRWRESCGPDRVVIDQVYLVADLSGFFEAVAAWNEHSFFPILFDDPAWSLPFLRAFRPSRVVRVAASRGMGDGRNPPDRAFSPPDSRAGARGLWLAAERAVARAWTGDDTAEPDLPAAGAVPRHLGPTPPGLVFSNPESPMLAGAVALAAGRFQPLVRLDPASAAPGLIAWDHRPQIKTFHDVLSLSDARRLARLVEAKARAVASPIGGLGDQCDFLTLAVDWPYRYRNDAEPGVLRGEHALDDLIGRVLQGDEGGLASARTRWAFTGRLLGNPAASVYRAMCSLFLDPGDSLLWDTYTGSGIWSAYGMTDAAHVLGRLWP
ncbi:MAG: hypothetical protein ACP5XB_04175, partial [Isosphaeraceae bacterium]